MARRKELITQNDFSLGAARPEGEERDDLPLVNSSLYAAPNTIVLSTGQVQGRQGLLYEGTTTAVRGLEADFGLDRVYDLHLTSTGFVIYDTDGSVIYSVNSYDWTTVSGKYGSFSFGDVKFWAIPAPDLNAVLIGAQQIPIHVIQVTSAGVWSFGQFAFTTTPAGAKKQPYWQFLAGVTIQPSAVTGAITVTASSPIWTDGHNGTSIRYGGREILLGAKVSTTVINGTVVEQLPPTYDILLATASNYQLGDAVTHEILGGQGIITKIVGSTVTVVATSVYDGFSASPTSKLIGPNAKQTITSVTSVAPGASILWDMQLMSGVHGYAGHACTHKGRAYLVGFPEAPMGIAASVAGDVVDFSQGVNDGDGFVDALASDQGGKILYAVSTQDLIFLTSRGLFYQRTRDTGASEPVTPLTFDPIRFARIGCAAVEPIVMDDGVVFADAVGKQVYAMIFSGGMYGTWQVQNLTKYHAHLLTDPISFGGTQSGSETAEQFIYVVNADGTLAVCQWDKDTNAISWRPWVTTGSFKAVYQAHNVIRAIVDRDLNGSAVRTRERFVDGLALDCASSVRVSDANPSGLAGESLGAYTSAFATQFAGQFAAVYQDGWDHGDYLISAAGKPLEPEGNILAYPIMAGYDLVQIGLPFDVSITAWARRSVRTQSGIRAVKRMVEFYVTVQETGLIEIDGVIYGGYRYNEDLTVPPPLRTEQIRVTLIGSTGFERPSIIKHRPGPFRVAKLGFTVVI